MRDRTLEAADSALENLDLIEPSPDFSAHAHIQSRHDYDELYAQSINDPAAFWSQMANENITWFRKWDEVEEFDFEGDTPYARYFIGARLNASYNCLDRHLKGPRRNKAALIWQGESNEDVDIYTYQRLHREVCKAANMLKRLGVSKGDKVVLYLPMIPELIISMLACSRIGAVHCAVFSGLSAEALKDRIIDSEAKIIITANYGYRSGRTLRIKDACDEALEMCPFVSSCIVVRRVSQRSEMVMGRDLWWDDQMDEAPSHCASESMNSTDPLFLLYTSGSTAKPKGIVHDTGGYLLNVHLTTKYIFDLKETDVYWCTADVGWITGHSYTVYGPLSNGATVLMFEGTPNYPHPGRYWEVVEKFGVNIFYTSPTAIRAMMKEGSDWVERWDTSSLRMLASVGEPITVKAWNWYYAVVGREKCPIADTWWQTETGSILISTIPGAVAMKPGSAALPFFGVVPAVARDDGTEADPGEKGSLVIKRAWPGMMSGIQHDGTAFKNMYFPIPGAYVTGDGAYRDSDGYFWITGRIDDVMNVSGHRLSTAEIENVLVSCLEVAEAAVVGYPHNIKGEGIYAFVTLRQGFEISGELRDKLIHKVRTTIGPIAAIDIVHFADDLPKTRSGKIIRRILRKIAALEVDDLADVSTLSNPEVVARLADESARLRL